MRDPDCARGATEPFRASAAESSVLTLKAVTLARPTVSAVG